ncbi:MAG: hypothetical protein WD739_11425 [Actinomycetota bacterium]
MDLLFISAELQRACGRRRAMIEQWGPAHADLVAQRLQELDSVQNLADLELLPYLRLVPTRGGRVVMVHGSDGVRVRLRPEIQRQSTQASDGWRGSTAVVVLEVVLAKS